MNILEECLLILGVLPSKKLVKSSKKKKEAKK